MSISTFSRPELAVFHELLTSIGGKEAGRQFECSASFHLETAPTDQVQLDMQEDGEELTLTLFMFPEDGLATATAPEMAAIAAKWLRDTAARLEGAASRLTLPLAHVVHVAEAEVRHRAGQDGPVTETVRVLAELGWTPPAWVDVGSPAAAEAVA